MSVQNNLQKPVFTKSVMGYAPAEVDRYVDHVIERYNSVCRENSELKRRVLRLGVRLDELEAKLGECEKNTATKKVLDKSALRDIFSMLEEEKSRYSAYLDSLMDKLNAIAAEDEDSAEDDDSAWESVLESFIEEASAEPSCETSEDDTDTPDAEPDAEPCGATADEDSAESADKTVEKDCAEASEDASPDPEAATDEDTAPAVQKTPAEIAAELDFYQDNVYRDGESFDPMTLAAEITSRRSKPTYSELINITFEDNNNK